jgi:hypothetical protein
MSDFGSLAHLATIYDIHNCPRDDGGRLQDRGMISDYPGDEPQPFFVCSQCGHFWHVIELRRKSSGAEFRG